MKSGNLLSRSCLFCLSLYFLSVREDPIWQALTLKPSFFSFYRVRSLTLLFFCQRFQLVT